MKDISQLKVLLIEDQAQTRQTIRVMLSEMGITQIFESRDGAEGKELIDTDPSLIDIVVCDWNMPNMTGIEFLKYLRKINPTLPFLMVTARSDSNSVMEAMSEGVNAYIRKPFSMNELEKKIKAMLKKAEPA